jgi:hypothetical protein
MVMARRLPFFAEHYGLLPDTLFGGRPGRPWTEANIQACLIYPMKSPPQVEDHQCDDLLPYRASFMRGCQASIRFNDYRAEVVPLDNAGLVQDSPLHVPASECDTLGLRRISRLALFTP